MKLILGLFMQLVLVAVALWCAVRWAKHQDPDGNF
jgi:hypothetical protein